MNGSEPAGGSEFDSSSSAKRLQEPSFAVKMTGARGAGKSPSELN